MDDLLDTLCTLILLAAAIVFGFMALSAAGAWVMALFRGDPIVIVGGLPLAGCFAAVSRFFLRWI